MKKVLRKLTLFGVPAMVALGLFAFASANIPTALASDSESNEFVASGNVCLATEPTPISIIPAPDGLSLNATLIGESHTGAISQSSQWDELEGSSIIIAIGQELATFDFITNTFSGDMTGSLTVQTQDGLLTGSFDGTVNGMFADPTNLLANIFQSSASVDWNISGEEISAQGSAVAPNFTFDPTAGFCSDIFFDGEFTELSDEDEDDGDVADDGEDD